MQKSYLMEAESFSRKTAGFYTLIAAAIGFNSFSYYIEVTEPKDSNKSDFDYRNSFYTFWWVLGVQAGLEVLIGCWFFILIWQTFLFRFGLIGLLCREFSLLFVMVPANWVLFCIEKGLRTYYMWWTEMSAYDIWSQWGFYSIYWVRSVFNVGYYLMLVQLSLSLGDPEYYKPDRWLK
jgi:hypothetical protein